MRMRENFRKRMGHSWRRDRPVYTRRHVLGGRVSVPRFRDFLDCQQCTSVNSTLYQPCTRTETEAALDPSMLTASHVYIPEFSSVSDFSSNEEPLPTALLLLAVSVEVKYHVTLGNGTPATLHSKLMFWPYTGRIASGAGLAGDIDVVRIVLGGTPRGTQRKNAARFFCQVICMHHREVHCINCYPGRHIQKGCCSNSLQPALHWGTKLKIHLYWEKKQKVVLGLANYTIPFANFPLSSKHIWDRNVTLPWLLQV